MGLSRWVLGLCFLVCVSGAVSASEGSGYPTDRLIVKFKQRSPDSGDPIIPQQAVNRLQQNRGVAGQILRPMANGAYVFQLSHPHQRIEMDAVLSQLRLDADLEYVEVDHHVEPAADGFYGTQWYLFSDRVGVNADNAWEYSTGVGTVVGVLDTGVLPHEDLVGNLLPGYDFITDVFAANDGDGRDSDASDPGDGVLAGACGNGRPSNDRRSTWHGSHVTGIIAALADNGVGIHGIAHNAQILPLRVLGRCGGYTSDIVDAIMWGAGLPVTGVPNNPTPAQVLNLSLSTSSPAQCSQSYMDAINAAVDAGVMVVAAAGNYQGDADEYAPGNCPNVFTVAATTRFGTKADYTNAGSVVEIAAPGGSIDQPGDVNGIWSTMSNGEYAPGTDTYLPKEGTSMSTPMVSATVALMKSVVPDATIEEMALAMVNTTQNFAGTCLGCGSGILDSEESVKRILGLTSEDAVADLGLIMKGDNGKFVEDPLNPDEGTIQYKVEVTNHGPDDALEIDVGFIFPDQATLELLSGDTFMLCNIDTFVCRLTGLDIGQTAIFTVLVRTADRGKMDFAASVYGGDPDPNMDNNYATARYGGALFFEVLMLLGLFLLGRRYAKRP